MTSRSFDAAIFDLDGVITKTALVHSAAWQQVFNDYLRDRESRFNEPFVECTHERDYLQFIDGKPRYEGVRSFLESRSISLPYGDPSDAPEKETICGIGNRKNQAFNEILQRDGVKVFDATVAMMHKLRREGVRVGVASSSKNCAAILEVAGLSDLAETRVDGVVSAEMGLSGKPDADIFTTACSKLGVTPEYTVVIEDAVSGVQAGRNGNFGLVLGVARENNHRELLREGADLVVSDLSEISEDDIDRWFDEGLAVDNWSVVYHDYDPIKEKSRESLLAVGNGYICTRGAMEESLAEEHSYPATYMAGAYNRLVSKVGDRDLVNEDFVNIPNWLPITFKIDEGEWFDINNYKIGSIERRLDFRTGQLSRDLTVEDPKGRSTRIRSVRLVSMANRHLAGLSYTITPLNYSGKITVRCQLRADHINAGVARYAELNQEHLKPLGASAEKGILTISAATTESDIKFAQTAVTKLVLDGSACRAETSERTAEGVAETAYSLEVRKGSSLRVEKLVAICSSLDSGHTDPQTAATRVIEATSSFESLANDSSAAWSQLWRKMDVEVSGDRFAQKVLRLHLFHSLAALSPHIADLDVSAPARGLHGEAYRGHIFWDELYILPFYMSTFPEAARAALMYRYRRLDAAREYAKEHGYQGAMYPWQSGSDGSEETQILHLNPVSGEWGPDHSSLQRHVSLAIARNVWEYYHVTADRDFLESAGLEMLLEISRFWASKAAWNESIKRYSIDKVMGPDEFHEKYPESEEGGLRDNSYTNIMASWLLNATPTLLGKISATRREELMARLGLNEEELAYWREISDHLNLVISEEGVIAQYDGYFELEELDWDHYREKYGNIYRMDRILKAEGKSPDAYKVAKQADVLMAFYALGRDTVEKTIARLGYQLPQDYIRKNYAYYLARTSHGSTLSRLVHAQVAATFGDLELSWELYRAALGSDFNDIQGGTTGEGIHLGVMTGTVWVALTAYAGLNLSGDTVQLNPALPGHWGRVAFTFGFRGDEYHCEVTPREVRIRLGEGCSGTRTAIVRGAPVQATSTEWTAVTP